VGRQATESRIALGVAVLLAVLYNVNGRYLVVGDAHANVYLAVNVVENGSLGFSPSRTPQMFSNPWLRRTLIPSARVDPATGEPLFTSIYGPGAGLAAVPVFAMLRPVIGDLLLHDTTAFYIGKLAASLFAAAAAALLYLAARRWVNWRYALLLAFAFGVGTATWSATSQALWQHGPTSFFLMLGTYLFIRGGNLNLAVAGTSFAAAVACRPLAVVFGVAFVTHLLIVNRRGALHFAIGAVPVGVALAFYNYYWLGTPLRSGQMSALNGYFDFWATPFLEGLAGILISPSRGLFVFSPFLLLALPGTFLAWRRKEYTDLRPLSVAVLLVLIVHAKWPFWWGGHSYSYRIIVDLAGPLVLLTIPVLGWVFAVRVRRIVCAGLLVWSVYVHGVGVALCGGSWSASPDIDDPANYHRLWSLTDSAIPVESTNLVRAVAARR
jgi:hypothetical protein